MNRQALQKKVRHLVHVLVYENGYISPIDLFLRMEKITPKLVEEWRFGRVPYLERVLLGNLGQLGFILDTFRQTAKEMGLQERPVTYRSYGKGPKRLLRFSKYGTPHMEKRYSTHYVKKAAAEPPEKASPKE